MRTWYAGIVNVCVQRKVCARLCSDIAAQITPPCSKIERSSGCFCLKSENLGADTQNYMQYENIAQENAQGVADQEM